MALGRLLEQTELIPRVPSVAVGAVTVISPLELIRTKMQSQQLSYRELRLCIQSAVTQDGWLSLWRGWGPTVLRDVPFSGMPGDTGTWGHRAALLAGGWCTQCPLTGVPSPPALYWFNYELVRTWLCRQPWLDGATFTVSFTSGAISGTVSLGCWGSPGGVGPLWDWGGAGR